ncbi:MULTISPECIES: hypothetical protein [unclassified Shewanella]|uniref:hypothetical protein n=1 Tax=unclassified Shewanella TaxID=196818 RepID=UPI001BBC5C84|nr:MULTISPECIES: hypothetical protein [unclassified Shewanella]GIU05736.1 hypothetical protein TUM4444_02570 [Shewanella sp. MBTL60-112-B1]GIU25878.1 hypothetical protein TUM4445_04550 [Shewanella sp. MBTL60-112-B2]
MDQKGFLQRVVEGYEKTKKPLAYVMIFLVVLVGSIPSELLPLSIGKFTLTSMFLALSVILMGVLFEIYDKVVQEKKSLNLINSTKLYDEIGDIIKNSRKIKIQYIALAGRHGWNQVLEKLLNDKLQKAQANKVEFTFEVAMLDPEVCIPGNKNFERFDSAHSIARQIAEKSEQIKAIKDLNSSLELYLYNHMPNMIGFLVNNNYLFVTHCSWEKDIGNRNELTLRAGGQDYFVYDLNDDFGGQEFIARFRGWFEYIRQNNTRVVKSG